MAQITKRLCLPVGSYRKTDSDKDTIEYRDIGFVMEFEAKDGNKWSEIKLNADILSPVLFQLAKQHMDKGSSACRVKLFDMERKKTAHASEEPPVPGEEEGPF